MTELYGNDGATGGGNAAEAANPRPNGAPVEGDGRPVSVSARLGRLQFHHSGKFRVLQFADIQDGPKVSKDTIRLIETSLDAARPDIVVFSGNQIAGYDPSFAATFRKRRWRDEQEAAGAQSPRIGSGGRLSESGSASKRRAAELEKTRKLARKAIGQFLAPLIKRGVPFAVTYGNHDFQCGLDVNEFDAIYREFPGCLNAAPIDAGIAPGAVSGAGAAGEDMAADSADPFAPSEPRSCTMPLSGLADQQVFPCEPGTLALPVMDVERTRNVLALVLVNSGDYAREGGYGSPSGAALRFLASIPARIGTQSLVFQHMPLPQYYELLAPAEPNAPGAMQGYRTYASAYYVMDESKMQPGSYLGEGISCPDADCGEYDVLRGRGEAGKGESGKADGRRGERGYFGIVAGHDHRNGFVGELDGMMMVATPTCGFGSYGPAPEKRAARLFEFDIRHPHNPRTQLLEFGDLVGKPSSRKAYSYDIADVKAESEGMNLLHKKNLWDSLRGLFA